MNNSHLSRKFLNGALHPALFFAFFVVVSSSFVLFAKEARATTYCEGGIGKCYRALACPVGSIRIGTCFNAADSSEVDCCFGGSATPPASACFGNSASCYSGGCPNGTVPATGSSIVCPGGESCCKPGSSNPPPGGPPPGNPPPGGPPPNAVGSGLVPCGNADSPSAAEECQFDHFIVLAKNLMNFLIFVIAVPLAAISFAWAGWLYLSAAGNESKVAEAHKIFGYVVLGLCIALAAWLVVNAIVTGLGVKSEYNFLGKP